MSYFDVPSIWREHKVVSLTIMYYRTVTIIMLPGYVILWCTFYLKRVVSLTIMYYRTVTIIMLPGYVILWCTFYLKRDCLIDYYVLQNCNYYYVTWLCHTLMYLLFEERKVVSLTIMYYRTVTIIMLPGYVILWCTFYLKRVVSLTIMYYRTVTIIMLPGYVILWCTFYLKRGCLIDYYVLQNCNYYYVTWLCHTLMYLLFEESKLSHWLLCITEL